jgi:hypothetical protein
MKTDKEKSEFLTALVAVLSDIDTCAGSTSKKDRMINECQCKKMKLKEVTMA